MSLRDELLAKETSVVVASVANNTAAVATVAAPTRSDLNTIYITGFWISASAAPSAAVSATLKDGATIISQMEIPAAAFAPIRVGYGGHPFKISAGNAAVLTLPAVGGTTAASVVLEYYIGNI